VAFGEVAVAAMVDGEVVSHREPWRVEPIADGFVVQFLDQEDMQFGPWTAEEHAANFCRRLNSRWRRGAAHHRRLAA
jgi:hypothetical protein